MGQYYDVSDVKVRGRRVHALLSAGGSSRVTNRLVAVCDRGMFELAVDVTNPDEYDPLGVADA